MKKLLFYLFLISIISCDKGESEIEPISYNEYTVVFSASLGGSVSTAGGIYKEGQEVIVTATPNQNYEFVGWSDGHENPTRTIFITSNINITANFEIKKYDLNLTIIGEGEVIEEKVNTGRTTQYNSGTNVKLTAVANTGWKFNGWTGDVTSTINPINVIVNADKNITASFVIDQQTDTNALEIKSYVFNAVDENQKISSSYNPVNNSNRNLVNKFNSNKTAQEAYDEITLLAQEVRNNIIEEISIHDYLNTFHQNIMAQGMDTISQYYEFQDGVERAAIFHQSAIDKRLEMGAKILENLSIEGVNKDIFNNIVLEPTREINYALDNASGSLRMLVQLIDLAVESFELSNEDELVAIIEENRLLEIDKPNIISIPSQSIGQVFSTGLPDEDRFDRIPSAQEKISYFEEFMEKQSLTLERFRLNYLEAVNIETEWDNYIDNLNFNFNKNFALTISGRERPVPEAGYRYSVENAWLRDAIMRVAEARAHIIFEGEYRAIENLIVNNLWDGTGDNLPTRIDKSIRNLYLEIAENERLAKKYPPVSIGESDLDWPQYDSQFNPYYNGFNNVIMSFISRKVEAENQCGCKSIFDIDQHDSGGSHNSGGSHDSGSSHDSGNNGGSTGQSGN